MLNATGYEVRSLFYRWSYQVTVWLYSTNNTNYATDSPVHALSL
jgi:hypothetical protein